MTPFWMICRAPRFEHSKTEPRQRFATLAEAETAARDMANQTGHAFVILQSAAVIQPDTGQDRLI